MNRPAMWREMLKCVRAQINTYIGLFPAGPEVHLEIDSGESGFFIRRPEFPHVTVRADFREERVIELCFAYRRSDNADTVRWEDRITFRPADELDRTQFEHKGDALIDATEASKVVLRPIMDPAFRPPEG